MVPWEDNVYCYKPFIGIYSKCLRDLYKSPFVRNKCLELVS